MLSEDLVGRHSVSDHRHHRCDREAQPSDAWRALPGRARNEKHLVGRTGFEPVTSSVSGKSRAVRGVCHRRTESSGEPPDLGKESEWVVLSLGAAEHVGSHFWLSQRFGAPGAVQDAKVIEGRVRSDVGLILRTAELPDGVLEIYGPTGERAFLLRIAVPETGTQTSLVRTGQSMRAHACYACERTVPRQLDLLCIVS